MRCRYFWFNIGSITAARRMRSRGTPGPCRLKRTGSTLNLNERPRRGRLIGNDCAQTEFGLMVANETDKIHVVGQMGANAGNPNP